MSLKLQMRNAAEPPQLGMWVKIPALETIELIERAGYNFIVIDLEHGPMTLESCYQAIVVAQGRGLSALVRVPDASGQLTQRVLDMGADGLLVPHVRSPEDAARVVKGMLFPPLGHRGLGVTSRAGTWGLDSTSDYLEQAHQDVLRIPQLEDPEAIETATEICGVEGVNAVLVGQGDLTLSLGRPVTDPMVKEMVDSVIAVAHDHGIPCGSAVRTPEAAVKAAARGFDFILVGNDATVFGDAAQQLVKKTHQLLETH